MPGFGQQAPVERKVTREKISFMTEESATTLDYHREQADVPVRRPTPCCATASIRG